MNSQLRIQRGAQKEFDLTVLDRNGVLLDLTDAVLVFQARSTIASTTVLLEKTSGDGIVHTANQSSTGKGLAVMTFEEVDTATLPRQMRFGLWITDALGNDWPLVEHGYLRVDDSVVVVEIE